MITYTTGGHDTAAELNAGAAAILEAMARLKTCGDLTCGAEKVLWILALELSAAADEKEEGQR